MLKKLLQLTLVSLLFSACGEEQKSVSPQTQEKPELQLQQASFRELNGFSQDNLTEAFHAFELSCNAIDKIKTPYLGTAEIKVPTKEYQKVCARFRKTPPKNFRTFLEQTFQPYLVVFQDSSEGKFTSYYEAALHASRTPSERYKYPIYGKPDDLIEFNPRDFDPEMPSRRLVGRVEGQKLVPYYTRREIVSGTFDAPVILWADSYVDIYVMQIQGSAVARLDDGSDVRIGFADTNGREFKGIGSILLENKLIPPGQASMGNIKRWLKENAAAALDHMNDNKRYVFHRLVEAEGPIGALGVPLTAGRSLAVDKRYIPLGVPLWLETTGPHHEKIERLVMAQDIGGAIKGGVRGDYFWGSGDDSVLELAGKMNSKGRYFILLPKNVQLQGLMTNER
jgi:mltA domain protein